MTRLSKRLLPDALSLKKIVLITSAWPTIRPEYREDASCPVMEAIRWTRFVHGRLLVFPASIDDPPGRAVSVRHLLRVALRFNQRVQHAAANEKTTTV